MEFEIEFNGIRLLVDVELSSSDSNYINRMSVFAYDSQEELTNTLSSYILADIESIVREKMERVA